jgi:hypothetical protein
MLLRYSVVIIYGLPQYATSRKVLVSFPDEVTSFLIDLILPDALWLRRQRSLWQK